MVRVRTYLQNILQASQSTHAGQNLGWKCHLMTPRPLTMWHPNCHQNTKKYNRHLKHKTLSRKTWLHHIRKPHATSPQLGWNNLWNAKQYECSQGCHSKELQWFVRTTNQDHLNQDWRRNSWRPLALHSSTFSKNADSNMYIILGFNVKQVDSILL